MKINGSFSYEKKDLIKLPARPQRSNKGMFGRVLVIGGSVGMCGAAYLSAKAAYRSGAGLVEIFTPEENRVILQTLIPEAVLTTYSEHSFSPASLYAALGRADAVVIGVGLGQSNTACSILSITLQSVVAPTVIDADALNLIAKHGHLRKYLTSGRVRDTILTPHPGEASRLTGIPIPSILDSLQKVATELSEELNAICVLKDHNTVVATPHSDRIYVNTSGNSGMATGGSGDVLSGIIGSFLAQGIPADESARLGVFIHGLCGDHAKECLGERSMMASDLIDMLPSVLSYAEKLR